MNEDANDGGPLIKPNRKEIEQQVIYEAFREHAWLLRAEGLTYKQIGARLDLSVERVRQMIVRFSIRMRIATRKARIRVSP